MTDDRHCLGSRIEAAFNASIVVHRDEPGTHVQSRDCWCRPGVFEWWQSAEAARWLDEQSQSGARRDVQ